MIRNVANNFTWQIGNIDPGFASGRLYLRFAAVACQLHVWSVIQLDRDRYVLPAFEHFPISCCLLNDKATEAEVT